MQIRVQGVGCVSVSQVVCLHILNVCACARGAHTCQLCFQERHVSFQAEGGYPAAAPCTDRGHQVRGFTHMRILCVHITGGVHG